MMFARKDQMAHAELGLNALCTAARIEEGVHVTLDADSVSRLTQGDNIVFVKGDDRDLVEFAGADGWQCSATRYLGTDGRTYLLFTATLSSLPVQVYVDSDIQLILPKNVSSPACLASQEFV